MKILEIECASLFEVLAIKWQFLKVIAIRGATTVNNDNPEEINEAVKELIQKTFELNQISKKHIISIYFSITKDIKSINPATIARSEMNLKNISMICGQEAFIENSLPNCIRILIHTYTPFFRRKIKHVYLKNATVLRNDLK